MQFRLFKYQRILINIMWMHNNHFYRMLTSIKLIENFIRIWLVISSKSLKRLRSPKENIQSSLSVCCFLHLFYDFYIFLYYLRPSKVRAQFIAMNFPVKLKMIKVWHTKNKNEKNTAPNPATVQRKRNTNRCYFKHLREIRKFIWRLQ